MPKALAQDALDKASLNKEHLAQPSEERRGE
jgi:hypothetical protein